MSMRHATLQLTRHDAMRTAIGDFVKPRESIAQIQYNSKPEISCRMTI
jgi:hypothetical protein